MICPKPSGKAQVVTGHSRTISGAVAEVLAFTVVASWTLVWAGGVADQSGLGPPPLTPTAPQGWKSEHLAFALGNSGKVVGGPARWAVGGGLPRCYVPADQAGKTYLAQPGQRLYFTDQRRHVWLLEGEEIWPIAGCDDLGELDGPGQYARFIYTGSYGGYHSGFVANGYTAYMLDHGRLRRIQRQTDGTWHVDTVAGLGPRGFVLKPGASCKLADLPQLNKGLTIDTQGNLYFPYGGGVVRAEPQGQVSWLITPEQVAKDFAEIYAQRWPGAKPPQLNLGTGEGNTLVFHPSGEIYGWGRTFPPAWKVTPQGKFVPLVGYAPKDHLVPGKRWGKYDPACIEPHCPMGGGVDPLGRVIIQNEIPWATVRYEQDRASVLTKKGVWSAESEDYFRLDLVEVHFWPDGTIVGSFPQPGPSAAVFVRLRKEGQP